MKKASDIVLASNMYFLKEYSTYWQIYINTYFIFIHQGFFPLNFHSFSKSYLNVEWHFHKALNKIALLFEFDAW